MSLLAFSFANFEHLVTFFDSDIAEGDIAFPVFPLVVSKFANEKVRRNIFWEV